MDTIKDNTWMVARTHVALYDEKEFVLRGDYHFRKPANF